MKKVILAALTFAPALALAQGTPNLSNLETLLKSIGRLIDIALPIVVAIGLLVFFWGIVKFIFAGEEGKKEGRNLMIWGIVGLFVMVSVWGLVRFLGNAVGVTEQGGTVTPPTVQLK
ncbi:MAG: pilin [Patescibacteria group bacterium]